MNKTFSFSDKLGCLYTSIHFFRKHFMVILGFGFIAALGRVIQLGGFGDIPSWMNIVLEIVIESARVLLFLYVLGLASIKNGIIRVKHFFTYKAHRQMNWTIAVQKLKKKWVSILLSCIGFLLIAATMNYLIELVAYETCLFLKLKEDGILVDSSSEWTILLFFKNLSVIPFMLVFETVLLLWITNKFQYSSNVRRDKD